MLVENKNLINLTSFYEFISIVWLIYNLRMFNLWLIKILEKYYILLNH